MTPALATPDPVASATASGNPAACGFPLNSKRRVCESPAAGEWRR